MQRDRHNTIRVFEQFASTQAHLLGEWSGQRVPPGILQGVNDLSERALVLADRTRAPYRAITTAATRAKRLGILCEGLWIGDWGLVLSGERVTAPVADWRCDGKNGPPAGCACTAGQGLVEERAAYSA